MFMYKQVTGNERSDLFTHLSIVTSLVLCDVTQKLSDTVGSIDLRYRVIASYGQM